MGRRRMRLGFCVRELVGDWFHCGYAMLMSKTVADVVRRAMSERMKKFLEKVVDKVERMD